MKRFVKTERIDYGAGALFVFAVSFGVMAIMYGGGFLIVDPLKLIAFVISPFGAYTFIYSLMIQRDRPYYLSWGLIMFITGLSFAFYDLINMLVLFGLLLILPAATGLLEYWRRKK
ncbi:MAG: hypothetical protein QXX56_01235 [Candidatus Bathyarchaeia archaeon]